MLCILKHGYDVIIYYPFHFRYPAQIWIYSIACFLVYNLYSSNLRVFFKHQMCICWLFIYPTLDVKEIKRNLVQWMILAFEEPEIFWCVKKVIFVKYKLEDNAYSAVCLGLWVLSVDVQRREGSLYPDLLPRGNFVENVRFFILRAWVGFGNIGEEIW